MTISIEGMLGSQRRKMDMEIKEIVRDGNLVNFSLYRTGNAFYTVAVDGVLYEFPVSLEDVAGASLFARMKAITLMR